MNNTKILPNPKNHQEQKATLPNQKHMHKEHKKKTR